MNDVEPWRMFESGTPEPPMARAIELPAAKPIAGETFPRVAMPRSRAAVDLLIAAMLWAALEGLLDYAEVPQYMVERWPDAGLLLTNVVLGLSGLMIVALILVGRRQGPSAIGLNRAPAGRIAAAAVLAVPACYVASLAGFVAYAAAFGFDEQAVMEEKGALFELAASFPTALVVPFALFVGLHEEIMFRGFLVSRLRALLGSDAAVIVISRVLFGLMHCIQGTIGVFQTTAIGIALAAVTIFAKTLWPAIIAHAAFDGVNLLIMPWLMEAMKELEAVPVTN